MIELNFVKSNEHELTKLVKGVLEAKDFDTRSFGREDLLAILLCCFEDMEEKIGEVVDSYINENTSFGGNFDDDYNPYLGRDNLNIESKFIDRAIMLSRKVEVA